MSFENEFSEWYETAHLEVHGIHTVSDMQKAYTAGVQAERERCVRVAEDIASKRGPCSDMYEAGYCEAQSNIAAAIREG